MITKQNKWMRRLLSTAFLSTILISCSKKNGEDIDTTYPSIDVTAANAFPKQCSEIERGQAFTAVINVSDNKELGSLSIDIHHNFDHHSHSTEVNDCDLSAVKTPVHAFTFIQSVPIPSGQTTYTAQPQIEIPADIDPGDYHFLIRITDKEGWQTIKGLSIKIK